MRINIIKELSIKELKSQFDHLSGYILISIFVGLIYYFFLKTFFVNGVVSTRALFQTLPWFLAAFVPAITMGTFANESEKQTLEYLETKPIKQIELVIGKILGSTKFVFIAVLLTLPLPILISQIAPLDIGETISSYIGAFLLILAFSSLGVAVSTFYKNQIAAFLTSAALILVLIFIDSDIASINMPVTISNALAQFGIIANYMPFIRGVINISNLIYFTIFIIAAIGIAYVNTQKSRISNTTELYRKTFAIIISIAFVGLLLGYLSNYAGNQIGRIDLTSAKRYTLANSTKEILQKEGKITIEVYASDNLPPRYQTIYKEIRNLLTDYKSAANGNLEIKYLDPKTNGERLSTLNIEQVQFNTVGEDQLQIQQGYLALVILNEDESKKEKIDYIPSINELEYGLTSLINKIKSDSKPSIGFAFGNGERALFTDYSIFQQILSTEYDVNTFSLQPEISEETEESEASAEFKDPNLSQYNMIFVAGPVTRYSEESMQALDNYIKSGGNVVYLGDSVTLDLTTGSASKAGESTGKLFEKYGATINADLVYDTRNNLQIPLGNVITSYPLLIAAEKNPDLGEEFRFLPKIIVGPWVSSLNLDNNWQVLYSTTEVGGTQTENFVLDPETAQFPINDPKKIPVVAAKQIEGGGSLVILGSSRYFESQYLGNVQENGVLLATLAEKYAKGSGLAEIKAKNLVGSQFNYVEPTIKQTINYGAPIASIILLGAIGASRIYRKRRLAKIYA